MKYGSSAAFRQALEDRLLQKSRSQNVSLAWLRKLVAFDRFLARLIADQPDRWLVKGGLALQLRLQQHGRVTKDLDVRLEQTSADVHQLLVQAALLDLGDYFGFAINRPGRSQARETGGSRYNVTSYLDTRLFEQFHVDVGVGDPVIGQIERIPMPSLLTFADIAQTTVPCYPIPQHIAEKVHAYTRLHASGRSTRVKDLVDILLIAELQSLRLVDLREALHITFAHARTHALPAQMPDPPRTWAAPYRLLVKNLALSHRTLAAAGEAAALFLNPALAKTPDAVWQPASWSWQPL